MAHEASRFSSRLRQRNGAFRRSEPGSWLNFGVEVEEGVQAALELGFDLLACAFKDVHGDVGLVAVGELEGGIVDFGEFAGGEQP